MQVSFYVRFFISTIFLASDVTKQEFHNEKL